MSSRRANARNENSKNANTDPPIADQEVANAEFRNVIQMLAQSMAKKEQSGSCSC